jgi:hypothetical protein
MPARYPLAFSIVLLACVAASVCVRASPSKIDVRADAIAFYPYANQTLLSAEGHATVRVGDRTISADAIRIDLGHNRLLATNAVRVERGGHAVTGNAYVIDLATGVAMVMRLDPVPATYRLSGDDPGSEVEMALPAGTFEAIDLDGQRPFMRSHHAIVTPNGAVRMTPAEFPTAAGPSLTLPTFLYTLVQNQYISQSAAPAASLDQPYLIAGTPNSVTAANLRYDAQNGVTLGLDEHLVDGQRAYVATSFLPLRDRQFDITAYDVIRHGLQQTFTATQTFGPSALTATSYRLQESGALTIETLLATEFDASNGISLDTSTYPHDVGKYFSYQVHGGYGYDHNYGGFPYTNDFRIEAGGYVSTPSVRVFGSSVNAKYDYSFTAYDYPHEVTDGVTILTVARPLGNRVRSLATVSFEQSDNRYRYLATGVLALGLPDAGTPYYAPDGTIFPGYFAYSGLSTLRTYQFQTTVTGSGDNRFSVTFTHTKDFPQYHGFGRPPYEVDVDVKRRIFSTLAAEIERSYDFGWGGQYLSPQYYFAVSP